MAIRVVVSGAAGRMGREVCKAILSDSELELAYAVDINKQAIGQKPCSDDIVPRCVEISGDLAAALRDNVDVMVDFTHPSSVKNNLETAIAAGVNCVIGTTGMTEDELSDIRLKLAGTGVNVMVAPNFAIGAVLLMQMAKTAALYMDTCEIIELHHDRKADAPSGTALKTAEGINFAAGQRLKPGEQESLPGARGAYSNGVHSHSVRLPGLVAHQEVIFGGTGQTLSIRHDTIDRTSFMPGVVLAVKEVGAHPGLTYGLEHFLDIS